MIFWVINGTRQQKYYVPNPSVYEKHKITIFIYKFGVLHRFQHCRGHITKGSFTGRGNQCIQLVRVLYCKLLTIGMQLKNFLT